MDDKVRATPHTALRATFSRKGRRGYNPTTCATALAQAEEATAFVGLETASTLLLAVSGGPDSMALLHIAARWAAALSPPPALHVATVDHGLRPEAAEEAALVATAAATLGLPHATVPWRGPKPKTRIQERARAARYALLVAHAQAIGAAHILTAHHADDQAETVLMRLCRGSGIAGLAGMRRETPLAPGIALVRPLLEVPKAALVALCEAEGVAFVADPSNDDPAYARARLRRQAEALARLGLDRDALLRLARRMARADVALEVEAARMEGLLAPRRGADGHSLDLSLAGTPAPEILLRLLRRAIETGAPDGALLRLERLESLTDALGTALREGRPHRATLGGARIALAADGLLRVIPEAPRRRGLSSTNGPRAGAPASGRGPD